MSLSGFLIERKNAIVEEWQSLIMKTYPAETSKILGKNSNRFGNPIGYSISHAAEKIFTELIGDNSAKRQKENLDEIIRVRAIQDFSPSRAMVFMPMLKDAIRIALGKKLVDKDILIEYLEFENKIDNLCLLGFEVYMECREQIYKIRIDEKQRHFHKLLERVNIIHDEKHGITRGDVNKNSD